VGDELIPAPPVTVMARPDPVTIARRLVEDPKYVENLQSRMRDGVEPAAVVVHIWRLAYGDHRIHHKAPETEERFNKMREAVKRLREEDPERAKALDVLVMGVVSVVSDAEESDDAEAS
jgi:hypothetical protein